MLFEKLKGWLFGSPHDVSPHEPVTPIAGVVDWATIIWAYTQSLTSDQRTRHGRDKAEDECSTFGRGLAYGKIRIPRLDFGLRAELLGEPKIDLDTVYVALKRALSELGLLERVEIRMGGSFDEGWDVIIIHNGDSLPVSVRGPQRPDGSYAYRKFLTIETWFTNSPYIEAHNVESLRVFLRMAEILGYPAGPKHYANETPVRIEDIIVYATRWEDTQSGYRYLDVLYRPELVVSEVVSTVGCTSNPEERSEGAFRGKVYIGAFTSSEDDRWPQTRINNRPVYAAISQTPTKAILDARTQFFRPDRRHPANPSFGAS